MTYQPDRPTPPDTKHHAPAAPPALPPTSTFTHPDCRLDDGRYPLMARALELQARLDPNRVFEPPLLARALSGAGPYDAAPGCDVRKTCYCTDDAHCARGYECRRSRAFPELRACVPVGFAP